MQPNSFLSSFVFSLALLFLLILQNCQPKQEPAADGLIPPDPLMGDWQGQLTYDTGSTMDIAAQVIAYDSGGYAINMLRKFDSRQPALARLTGHKSGSRIHVQGSGPDQLSWQGIINEKEFTGSVSGPRAGNFSLKKTVRLSPTMGRQAPAGAIVLFDGSSLDEWEQVRDLTGYINLARLVGGTDRVSYLKTNIWSDANQSGYMLLGSDDGVKLWLNGQQIHQLNVGRGAAVDDDTVRVELKSGWNAFMLKINNGYGGWGAICRLTDLDFQPLTNIAEQAADGHKTRTALEQNNNFLTRWQLSAPYARAGKNSEQLFDIAFEPETDPDAATWQAIDLNKVDYSAAWPIIGPAMRVKPGSGSLITRRKFTDFTLHLEFRSPFMPASKGQARGNSGVYFQGRYEVQVLDSYGLEGADNECGGIYKVARPLVNMCAPPGQWQTYDVTFRAPRFDDQRNKISDALITVIHNGVTIHDNLAIPGPTGGALDQDVSQPGPLMLQDHGDLVEYRNIWLVENAEEPIHHAIEE